MLIQAGTTLVLLPVHDVMRVHFNEFLDQENSIHRITVLRYGY